MKKSLLLYNPMAGNRQLVSQLDYIAERMQALGYTLQLYRSEAPGAIKKQIINEVEQDIDLIMIAGGDGTINECVNGLFTKNLDIPVGILPLGTANDFATTANIPNTLKEAINIIEENNLKYVDVGKVNEQYFINVCNMGIFSGVSHEIDLNLKKNFGKLAYYAKGIEELKNYETMNIEIISKETSLKGRYVFILVFNGKGAGGFNKMAKQASITDGYLDLVAIKDVEPYEIPALFLKMLQGQYLDDNNVDYARISKATIKCRNLDKKFVTDIDGEIGPSFPLEIEVVSNKFKIFMPKRSGYARKIPRLATYLNNVIGYFPFS
ncbi:lipid kinase [Candidatus Epulonipiscium fishelsonii]|uniref:Lipid kinase n=1 Tax=Candidatus Epulonipiscium fishelsonii TaxID=77094 RepID=A0ACC8XAM2_9FIRM|nr:lipid kinase [Epulopiscium sp. SCG-B11WGA-EpuloA1]ONI40138.1 lipid kinase [Epulopiscium sp. SCG-B05WGA-EpuloA1]